MAILRSHLRENLLPLCAAIPVLLYGILFFVCPFLIVGYYSTRGRDFLGGVTSNTSYEAWSELASPLIAGVIWRSLVLALINTLVCMIIGIPVSIYLRFGLSGKHRRWALALLSLPLVINSLLVAYSWQTILGSQGFLAAMLARSGIEAELLFRPQTVFLGLFSAYLAFFILPFSASLDRIDERYAWASQSLGVGPIKSLERVILPMSRSGLVAGGLLVFLPSFTEYVIPDLLGGGKVLLIGNLIQLSFYEGHNWPLGSALMFSIVLALVPVAAFFPIARRLHEVFGRQ